MSDCFWESHKLTSREQIKQHVTKWRICQMSWKGSWWQDATPRHLRCQTTAGPFTEAGGALPIPSWGRPCTRESFRAVWCGQWTSAGRGSPARGAWPLFSAPGRWNQCILIKDPHWQLKVCILAGLRIYFFVLGEAKLFNCLEVMSIWIAINSQSRNIKNNTNESKPVFFEKLGKNVPRIFVMITFKNYRVFSLLILRLIKKLKRSWHIILTRKMFKVSWWWLQWVWVDLLIKLILKINHNIYN